MTLNKEKKEIIYWSDLLNQKGMVSARSGNVSCKVGNDKILITSHDCYFANNQITGTQIEDGIRLRISHNNTIIGNNVSYNDDNGIWIDEGSNNTIDNNIIINNTVDGIRLSTDADKNNITNNLLLKNMGYAVVINPAGSVNNLIHSNNF